MSSEIKESGPVSRRNFLRNSVGAFAALTVAEGLDAFLGYPLTRAVLGSLASEEKKDKPELPPRRPLMTSRNLQRETILSGLEGKIVSRSINGEHQRAVRFLDANGNPFFALAQFPRRIPDVAVGSMQANPHIRTGDEYIAYQSRKRNLAYPLLIPAPPFLRPDFFESFQTDVFPFFNKETYQIDWIDENGDVLGREEKPFYQLKEGESLDFETGMGGYWVVGIKDQKRDFTEIYEPTLTDKQLEVKLIRLKLVEIYKRFGIEIPYGPNPRFQAQLPYIEQTESSDLGIELVEEGQTATLTLEEVTIIEEALKKVPSPGVLAQLILPFRYRPNNSMLPEIPHGLYFGRRWRSWLEKGLYPCSKDPNEPFDEEAAIILFLPQGFNPQKPFPSSDFHYFSPGIQLSEQPEEIYRRNQGEHLKQMLVHELGHGLDDQVGLRTFPMPRQHCEHLGKLNLCRFENMEPENRIYQTFAVVNHWRLASSKEIYLSCGGSWSSSSKGEALGWMRDYRIWGYPPKMRISNFAIEGNIGETFAEFWMASILFPQLLTYEERMYFNNIHRGLGRDPEEFLQKVANQPEVLLRGTKFELSIGY